MVTVYSSSPPPPSKVKGEGRPIKLGKKDRYIWRISTPGE